MASCLPWGLSGLKPLRKPRQSHTQSSPATWMAQAGLFHLCCTPGFPSFPSFHPVPPPPFSPPSFFTYPLLLPIPFLVEANCFSRLYRPTPFCIKHLPLSCNFQLSPENSLHNGGQFSTCSPGSCLSLEPPKLLRRGRRSDYISTDLVCGLHYLQGSSYLERGPWRATQMACEFRMPQ